MTSWSHTAHYHDVLLRAVPRPCPRALDVGCGEGDFARRLSERAGLVVGLDRSPEVIARAEALSEGIGNLRFVTADFLTGQLEPSSYDYVSALASLHHLPFAAAIERMKDLLRTRRGAGDLGLYRASTLTDLAWSAVAFPASRWLRLTRGLAEVNAPVTAPSMTLREIREAAARLLPGAMVTRHLLWRYSLIWTK